MDAAFDSWGRIWFTDPELALRMMDPPLGHASVLRLEHGQGGAWGLKRMTRDTLFPIAIGFSSDERSVYVADNPRDNAKLAELRTYPLRDDDTLGGAAEVLHCFPPGGGVTSLCVDSQGNLVVCLGAEPDGEGASVAVFSSTGAIIGRHAFGPGTPTNCAFGDHNRGTRKTVAVNVINSINWLYNRALLEKAGVDLKTVPVSAKRQYMTPTSLR